MIKNISMGIFQAVEVLQKLSLSRSARWHFEQNLKARRDRWAEDEYVREEGAILRDEKHIKAWLQKGYSIGYIAELLDEDIETVRQMCESLEK